MKISIEESMRAIFSPEFLNRIDEHIVFRQLEKTEMHRIIDIQVESLVKRLQGLEIALELTSDAKDFLVEVGSDVKNGARPLKRAIQRFVEDTLAEEILKGTIKKSSKVVVDFDAEARGLTFQSPSVKASKRSKEKQTA